MQRRPRADQLGGAVRQLGEARDVAQVEAAGEAHLVEDAAGMQLDDGVEVPRGSRPPRLLRRHQLVLEVVLHEDAAHLGARPQRRVGDAPDDLDELGRVVDELERLLVARRVELRSSAAPRLPRSPRRCRGRPAPAAAPPRGPAPSRSRRELAERAPPRLPSTTRSGRVARMNDSVPGKSECAEKEIVATEQRTSMWSVVFP